MTGYGLINQMTPSDADLFATLTMLCHRFSLIMEFYTRAHWTAWPTVFHDCQEMDHACFVMDEMLARWVPKWREMGYDLIITADHGQDARGHHGGHDPLQQEFCITFGVQTIVAVQKCCHSYSWHQR